MDLAAELRSRSLVLATRSLALLYGVGSLVNLRPLLSGADAMAFVAPFSVFVLSSWAARDAAAGREARARAVFGGTMVTYLTVLMAFAPVFLRVAIGFPLSCLALLLFHLIYRNRVAAALGWVVLAVVVVGFAAAAVTAPESRSDWMLVTGAVAQTLVLAFTNLVLSRLGRGWAEALAEAHHAQAQASEAYRMANEASEAKSRFLAAMSHELRTPLNAVIGYAELVEEEVEVGELPDPADLQRIRRAGRHLLELVNQVLDLSRVESGRSELEKADVSLSTIAREVCETLRPQLRASGSQLVLELSPVGSLQLDALRVRQIVTNLVGNAAKFTRAGTVSVSVRVRAGRVVLAVADDGPGIPADRLARIFVPFAQADATVQRLHGGTGLGLAISRKLAEEMGGTLEVRSEVGRGATFELSFPRVADEGRADSGSLAGAAAK